MLAVHVHPANMCECAVCNVNSANDAISMRIVVNRIIENDLKPAMSILHVARCKCGALWLYTIYIHGWMNKNSRDCVSHKNIVMVSMCYIVNASI